MAWAPDNYASLTELKGYLRVTDGTDDTELAFMLAAGCREVDRRCNRQFGIVDAAELRYYPSKWDRRAPGVPTSTGGLSVGAYVVDIDDLMTTDNLVITSAGSIVVAADYTLYPRNAAAKSRPWTRLEMATASDEVQIVAEWGWAAVLDPIKQGTLLECARLNARRSSPFGIAGSPDQGSEIRLLAQLDVDAAKVLGPFTRWWAVA